MKNLKKEPLKFLELRQSRKMKEELKKSFAEVLDSGYFILGPKVKQFEKEFAKYLGVKFCIGVGNGLEAIQISLMALGIGKGNEVITTPISAVATTLAILAVGGKPVFVDTTEDGLINPNLIPKAITKKTKAILPVHLYGASTDLKQIQNICKKHHLYLIEDAAQAHGSKLDGKFLGSFGNLGCFSFYPTKNLGALGDGGAIVTNNRKLAKICLEIRDYGQRKKYYHVRFGLNSRLDEIQAAILTVKLSTLEKENNERRLLAAHYTKNLSHLPLEILKSKPTSDSCFHQFVIKVKRRNQLQKFLVSKGIPTLIHYPKIISDQPFLKPLYINVDLPISREFVKNILSLPLHPNLSVNQINYICSSIKEFYKRSFQTRL